MNAQTADMSTGFMDASDHEEARRYQREKLAATLIALSITSLALLFLAVLAAPMLDELARGIFGESRWLRLLFFGVVTAGMLEIVTLPIDFWSGFVLEHRHGLSNLSLRGWIWRRIKGYAITAPIAATGLFGGYALLWYFGHWWWVLAAVAWVVFTILLGMLLPVVILPLFFKLTRLEESPLVVRLRRLIEGTGLRVEGIFRLDLSDVTRKANAALAGMGRSRRVLLGDTLLREFTPDEIEVVFAHEVGHHVFHHLPKMLVLQTVLATAGLFLADRALVTLTGVLGYHGTATLPAWQDPSTLPLVILVLGIVAMIVMPLMNGISRAFERQCDRYALRRTGLVDAYRSAFQKLGVLNKVDPDPPALAVWFLEDHPPLRERLALADVPLVPAAAAEQAP